MHDQSSSGADQSPAPVRLPGIGHHLELTDEHGHAVSVIRQKDGTVEIHAGTGPVVLGASQARALGALASGHFSLRPELIDRTAGVLGGIEFDWVTVPKGAWAAGLTIEDLAIRQRTGTTIVAILRGSLPVVAPDPHERIEVGDELVVVCRPDERASLERYLSKGR